MAPGFGEAAPVSSRAASYNWDGLMPMAMMLHA